MEIHVFRRLLIRNVATVLFGLFINQSVQTIGRVVIARVIHSPVEFGQASLLLQIFGLSALFLNLGFNTAEVYLLSKHGLKAADIVYNTALMISLLIGCVVSLILLLLAPWFADMYHDPALKLALALGSATLVFTSGTNIVTSALSGLKRFSHQSIALILSSSLTASGLIVGVILEPQSDALYGIALGNAVFSGIGMMVLILFLAKGHNIRVLPHAKLHTAKKMIVFGAPMWAGNIAKSFQQPFLVVITGESSVIASGFLNNGLQIVGFLNIVTWAFTVVSLPRVSEVQHNTFQVNERCTLCFRYNNLLLFPLVVFILGFPQEILHGLFGSDYVNPETVQFTRLLALGVLFSSVSRLGATMLAGLGKPRANMYVMLVSGGMLLTMVPWIVPRTVFAGPWIYMVGWALSAMALFLIAFKDGLRFDFKRSFIQPIIPAALSGAVMMGVNFWMKSPLVSLGLCLLVCIALTMYIEYWDRRRVQQSVTGFGT